MCVCVCAVGFCGAREPEFRPALRVRACVAFPPSPGVPSRAEKAVFFSPTCYLVCTVFETCPRSRNWRVNTYPDAA